MLDNILRLKHKLTKKRKARIRGRIFGDSTMPRVSVFRSNRYFYAQAIDDTKGFTLASVDGNKLGLSNNKDDVKKVAAIFAENLKKAGISKVVFDRNGYLYHGVVASFADALRENGIVL
ncbi:50S ribosomal protein L18 [Helicobacter sp. MIT 14-3879]|uniref:50S ribosomal protein L18 n=1 Tax=Helicobacter sp. MIT 14-3879 TaxID=2040649 RepID=UPI000E1FA07D|nr:50S ribosomal protein L18 [Helicobacter sp. MIT 14-3879]RDU64130.1 50S ribosomal protein L18 [Helicobacter sp. MIT 14-3879]